MNVNKTEACLGLSAVGQCAQWTIAKYGASKIRAST